MTSAKPNIPQRPSREWRHLRWPWLSGARYLSDCSGPYRPSDLLPVKCSAAIFWAMWLGIWNR